MTVTDLSGKLTMREYYGWVAYFEEMNNAEGDTPTGVTDLDNSGALLKEFNL